jgi:hypothetical protein
MAINGTRQTWTKLTFPMVNKRIHLVSKADSYPHFTNGFCEMAYQAKSYGRLYHNLYHRR